MSDGLSTSYDQAIKLKLESDVQELKETLSMVLKFDEELGEDNEDFGDLCAFIRIKLGKT